MNITLLILCSLGMINGLFLTVFFAYIKGEHHLRKYLLSALVGLTSLRIGKYLVISFNLEVHAFYHIIWFGSLSLLGTLVYFLLRSSLENNFKLQLRHVIHLLPSIIVIVAIAVEPFKYIDYYVGLFIVPLVLAYLVYSTILLLRYSKINGNEMSLPFSVSILFGAGLLWLVHFTALLWRYNLFMAEAILFSFYVYFMTFWMVKNEKMVKAFFKSIPLPSKLSRSEIQMYAERIETYLNNASPYLRNSLTLPELAKELKLSHHLLSKVINEHYLLNFNDLINRYRIEHAKKLIKSEEYKNITFSGIAFDSGFSSISVFNVAFKKFTGQTPSQFRNCIQA